MTPQPPRTRPPRIVVVDDEDFCLEVFKLFICDYFKHPTLLLFSSTSEAWEELSRTDPDLLILDMPMLEPDLLPLLAERKVTYPILATSGYYQEEDDVRQRADPSLNLAFIKKPFLPTQFNRELLALLGPSDNPNRTVWK